MSAGRPRWLFSPAEDLLAFALPTFGALLFCAALPPQRLHQPLSPLGFLLTVVAVDVAHVWSTLYRVYAYPAELRRRLRLYLAVPAACYLIGLLAYAAGGGAGFWRMLAYLAVFHFVRQQYGWIMLSRARDPRPRSPGWGRLDRWLDGAAIYAGTLYPLLWWHCHLPRRFHWFLAGDFVALPPWLLTAGAPLWALIGALWAGRQLLRLAQGEGLNLPKALVMTGTWASWYGGIVALDSDVAFTLTNVLAHGVPYMLVTWRYHARRLAEAGPRPRGAAALVISLLAFYLPLLLLSYGEEALWDRLVWHEHGGLFPFPEGAPIALTLLVPLLALPQATHYALDAWIWRQRGDENPRLRERLGL